MKPELKIVENIEPQTFVLGYHPLPAEDDLRMSSIQIAKLCNKQHKHVLRDIDDLIEQLNGPDLGLLIFELKGRRTRKETDARYFEMDENAALLVVSGYNVNLRLQIIKEWRFYREAFHNRQWHNDDIDTQKRVMGTIKQALLNHQGQADKLDYIKANTIVDKAVSTLYGFDKMLKKPEMSRPMLDDRQRILEDYEKLFSVKPNAAWVKEVIYAKYQPKLVERMI
jgi:phage regulator Rha-like protein